jgi:hypothetical protein
MTFLASNFEVPAVVAKGGSSVLRITLNGTGGSLAAMQFWVRTPNGLDIQLTTSFSDVSASLGYAFVSVFELNYTFADEGLYTFFLYDTGTSEVWVDSTFAAEWAQNMDVKASKVYDQYTNVERVRSTVQRRMGQGGKNPWG